MAANESEERYYLPDGCQDLAELRRLLVTQDAAVPRLALTDEDTQSSVELPEALCRMLVQAVDAMSDGQVVAVVPRQVMLTRQQAADLLQVSRSTVTRLIADGELSAEQPGSRRGLRLTDVLDARERLRLHQHEMLAETFSGLSVGAADGEVVPIMRPDGHDAPEDAPAK